MLLFAVSASLLYPIQRSIAVSLHERYSPDQLAMMFANVDDWRPFPRAGDRAAWSEVAPPVRAHIIGEAEGCLNQPIPQLPATLYLEYQRNGNRSRYQDAFFERRTMLHTLVLAECLEAKGRFLDKIADLVWAICEESSWTVPAHVRRQRAGIGLPDVDDPVVALFSAETGASLTWTAYLLEPQLDSVSPLIVRRMHREIQSRILTPYLEREFGWMGFRGGRPNNWNPWINSNVLLAALIVERDAERRMALIDKILRSVDRFLVPYPADGSCDEGPSYWGHAGASLFDCLELLYGATEGRFAVWEEPQIKEIGRFIYRTHIAGDYFVNVGDCAGRVDIYRDLTWRFGQRIGDTGMQDLAACGATVENLLTLRYMTRTLFAAFNATNVLAAAPSAQPPLPRDVWLSHPDMQLMVARDAEGQSRGLFVAAWGSHNAQSHNHNDVGNVIVFVDGQPVLVDAGKPTYTRQTFSSRRYDIWCMQSDFHNCPTINGHAQRPGRRYAAKDVQYRSGDDFAELQMDLAAAYPDEAKVASWLRTIRLNRGHDVTIDDAYQLTEQTADTALNFLTPCTIRAASNGRLVLEHGERAILQIEYDPAKVRLETETITLDDSRLVDVWGNQLHRLRLVITTASKADRITLVCSPIDRAP